MNGSKLESIQWVKGLGVTIPSSLKFSQQCDDPVGKVNRILQRDDPVGKVNTILGFINRNFSFKIYTKLYHCISA